MYDPVLGRFIQADSIVQDPFDPQSLNRYAYVQNNPLSATNPSGNISFKNALRLGVAIGITVVTSGVASGAISVFGFTATTTATAFGTAVVGGALAGALTGGAKGAVMGAFGSAAFFGVGEVFANLGNAQNLAQAGDVTQGLSKAGLTAGQTVAKIAAHATIGGTMAVLQGGKFGHGFLNAGLNESVAGRIGRIGNPGGQIAASAILGGTTSSLVGGKFANGAITAAFATAFNELVHRGYSTSEAGEEAHRYLRTGRSAVAAISVSATAISATAVGADVEITYSDGTVEVRSGGTRAWRNNNPGNLRNSAFSLRHGSIGAAANFAVFINKQAGTDALTALLNGGTFQNLNINQAIARFAPVF